VRDGSSTTAQSGWRGGDSRRARRGPTCPSWAAGRGGGTEPLRRLGRRRRAASAPILTFSAAGDAGAGAGVDGSGRRVVPAATGRTAPDLPSSRMRETSAAAAPLSRPGIVVLTIGRRSASTHCLVQDDLVGPTPSRKRGRAGTARMFVSVMVTSPSAEDELSQQLAALAGEFDLAGRGAAKHDIDADLGEPRGRLAEGSEAGGLCERVARPCVGSAGSLVLASGPLQRVSGTVAPPPRVCPAPRSAIRPARAPSTSGARRYGWHERQSVGRQSRAQ